MAKGERPCESGGFLTVLRLIETHRAEILGLCRQHYVRRLEVFGSAACGDFDDASSDLDFLVEFGDVPAGGRFDNYFALQRALSAMFDRNVDLVEPGGIRNPYFLRRVNESRELVYAA